MGKNEKTTALGNGLAQEHIFFVCDNCLLNQNILNMGEIKYVKCKHCGTEWEMPIGPIMSTPEEFVFPFKCEECGKYNGVSLREHIRGRYRCDCGEILDLVAFDEYRRCPKCNGEEYELLEVMMVD